MSLTSPVAIAALDGGADRDDFVGIDACLLGSLPLNSSLTSRCTIGTRVEPPTSTTSSICSGFELRVLQRVDHRLAALLDQRRDQLLELRPRDRHLQVLRAGLVGGDERQVDRRLHRVGELDLRLLGTLPSGAAGPSDPCAGRCPSCLRNSSAM